MKLILITFQILYTLTIYLVSVSSRNIFPNTGGLCLDFCAKSIGGLGQRDWVRLSSQCSSYLRTTVASTVVTATSITTFIFFKNNGDHNPLSPTLQEKETKTTQTGTDGFLTIVPTEIPDNPFRWPACRERKNGKGPFTTQFSSICSCNGVIPTTTSVPTLTTTSIEQIPTTILQFKLKARFSNGTSAYLEPKNAPNQEIPSGLTGREFWVMGFDTSKDGSAFFGLTTDKDLMLESRKLKGWMPSALGNGEVNGRLMGFLQDDDDKKVDGHAPSFYIDVASKPGEGYVLALEEKNAGQMRFFSVGIPGFELMWLGAEGSAKDLPGSHEPVQILAEPVL